MVQCTMRFSLTLSHLEVWIRQLMTVRGMSAQKAASLSESFPSLTSLMELIERSGPDAATSALAAVG